MTGGEQSSRVQSFGMQFDSFGMQSQIAGSKEAAAQGAAETRGHKSQAERLEA